MKIEELVTAEKILSTTGDKNVAFGSIHVDSRQVEPGGLFIAALGSEADGHDFVGQALENGAIGIICEKLPEILRENVLYIEVKNSRLALSEIAGNFYGNPSKTLTVIGITGTNGKTTTTLLIHQILASLGKKSGYISTIEARANNVLLPRLDQASTTPGIIELQRLLSEMKEQECEYVVMEVSSHALSQGRVNGITFTGGVFTNLSQDHLDYHHSMEEYAKVKQSFFLNHLLKESFAIINSDDQKGRYMVDGSTAKILAYGQDPMDDYHFDIGKLDLEGSTFTLNNIEFKSPLMGEFNVYNLVAALGALNQVGIDLGKINDEDLENLSVPGRSQITRSKDRYGVVDYAHTPDGVDKILISLKEASDKRVITVIGAGGDRDRTKRPLMTKAAIKHSDIVILTSDNPRSEDPKDIIQDMQEGVYIPREREVFAETDRRRAIQKAVDLSKPGDVIAILGKGHETYQEVNGEKLPFEDQKELELSVQKLN